ncbi:hypothetical protein MNBD_GAMMA11-31 [hydrothermal vent metagenome]|uniref:Cytochrome b561 bacterial/Ni-hydrogenase domain-containing protein n=1 Tax=hydrothermal vent metagenome TaxID=652676 RepID=A0A3B0WRE0_9ZZZZ
MSHKIKVWDLLIRFFHWVLVIAFTLSYFSGEEESSLHIYSGYVVLWLIGLRVLWGFVGTKYARFKNFVHGKKIVFEYLTSLFSERPVHYTGHNPAGGWMVVALILSLFATTLSGLQLYAIEEGAGPLAHINTEIQLISTANADDDSDFSGERDDEEFWEAMHEIAANFTLLLIFIHIAGVFVASKLHRENLLKAMISGYKSV